ncbi:hypothetical protein [Flavobacterium croceum]|nr:hypothetical protein [Flavobacterium croceum]
MSIPIILLYYCWFYYYYYYRNQRKNKNVNILTKKNNNIENITIFAQNEKVLETDIYDVEIGITKSETKTDWKKALKELEDVSHQIKHEKQIDELLKKHDIN